MAAKCAREECGKTVYPLEELKCLDKTWHKQCFKCTSCGMVLNMKTYKGFEKRPYCDSHYPKFAPTSVTSTPAMDTAKANTEFQSQVNYHSQYEKSKGQKIQVADDPELKRLMQNSKFQSQAEYHKDQDKKRQPETDEYSGEIEIEESLLQVAPSPNENVYSSTTYTYDNLSNGNGSINSAYCLPTNSDSPYSQRLAAQAAGTVVYSSTYGGQVPLFDQRKVGSIADYDPMNGVGTSPTPEKEGQKNGGQAQKASTTTAPAAASAASQRTQPQGQAQQAAVPPGKSADPGFVVRALYDYSAADKDEVSFQENDVIVNCQAVDEGWMTGTVQRTHKWGMLPANYVERVNQPTGRFKIK